MGIRLVMVSMNRGVENKKVQEEAKIRPKKGSKKVFGTRQVGAFCKFWPRHTGGPFIFCPKTLFFQKIEQFRG